MNEEIVQIENTKSITAQQEVSQYGSLPDPNVLVRYEQILSGAAERILRSVEREQEYRHKIQEKKIDAAIADQKDVRNIEKRGQLYALIISVVIMGIAGFSL